MQPTPIASRPQKPLRMLLPFFFFLAVCLISSLQAAAVDSANKLMVYPTRIIVEGAQKTADITLINNSDRTVSYVVDMVEMAMPEEGGLKELPEGQKIPYSAADLIKIAPKRVTLPPSSNQQVRLLLRKSNDLEAGEYRIHLRIHSVPTETQTETKEEEGGVNISFEPRFNLTVPVIIRHGETYFTAKIDDIKLEHAKEAEHPKATVIVSKEGNRSIVFDLSLFYTGADGEEVKIGNAPASVIYRENPRRIIEVPITLPEGTVLSNGKVKVVMMERLKTKPGKKDNLGAVLAEAEAELP